MTEKIEGTVENWENGSLGADEQYVRRADATDESKLDEKLGLVTINLKMSGEDVNKLEALAKQKGLILQALIRTILKDNIPNT